MCLRFDHLKKPVLLKITIHIFSYMEYTRRRDGPINGTASILFLYLFLCQKSKQMYQSGTDYRVATFYSGVKSSI
jgi:hypothetical protein